MIQRRGFKISFMICTIVLLYISWLYFAEVASDTMYFVVTKVLFL